MLAQLTAAINSPAGITVVTTVVTALVDYGIKKYKGTDADGIVHGIELIVRSLLGKSKSPAAQAAAAAIDSADKPEPPKAA